MVCHCYDCLFVTHTCVHSLGLPSSPGNVTAVGGDREVFLTWVVPESFGLNITSYIVTENVGNRSVIVPAAAELVEFLFTDLVNGLSYLFFVVAESSVGRSVAGVSNSVVPIGVCV